MKGINVTKSIGEVFSDLYFKHKKNPYIGMWMMFRPALLVNDPELIKTIVVKDFASFQDRGFYVNEKDDPLSGKITRHKAYESTFKSRQY